jgi:hypothetical protein
VDVSKHQQGRYHGYVQLLARRVASRTKALLVLPLISATRYIPPISSLVYRSYHSHRDHHDKRFTNPKVESPRTRTLQSRHEQTRSCKHGKAIRGESHLFDSCHSRLSAGANNAIQFSMTEYTLTREQASQINNLHTREERTSTSQTRGQKCQYTQASPTITSQVLPLLKPFDNSHWRWLMLQARGRSD